MIITKCIKGWEMEAIKSGIYTGAHIQNIWGGGAFRSGTDFYVRI